MKWLFLVHQIQSPHSREKVRVWRLIRKSGAVLYRNSVYVVPFSRENLERLQWMCQEINDSKGEGSFFIAEPGDKKEDAVLRQIYNRSREQEFKKVEGMVREIGEFASSQKQFELYLVITRLVVDVMGKPDQEQYVGLFEKSGSNWKKVDPVSGQPGVGNPPFRARVLEVQRVPGKPKAAGNLWGDLFESAKGSDAAARIVRISQPIESQVAGRFTCPVLAPKEAIRP